MPSIDRRRFIAATTAALAAPSLARAQAPVTIKMGALKLTNVQNWTFPHTGDTFDPCSTTAASFTGGDVVLTQYQVATESPVYDHDHPC